MYIHPNIVKVLVAVLLIAGIGYGGFRAGDTFGGSAQQIKAINSNLQQQGKVFNDKVVVSLCGKKGGQTASELGVFGPYAVQCADKRVFVPGYSLKK